MQTNQRHQFSRPRPTGFSAHRPNSGLSNLSSGGRMPAGALSTYTKIIAPALLTATLWSHVSLGMMTAIVATSLAIVCLILLQRIPAKRNGKCGWAKSVGLGERIWLNRLSVPIPSQLGARITTLYVVFWLGSLIALLGGATASPVLAATSLAVAYCTQFVCFHKLIQLFRQMKDKAPLYRFWLATPGNDNARAKP